MANINVNEIGYNEVLSAGTANALMVQYKRANAAPMDITEVHTTKQSAENYARNGSTSYAGQIISEAGENIKTKAYKITSGGTLLELIDEETLTEEIAKVVGGGELNLKDYAKTEYVDERDNEILQAAKDYADGITSEIDFSPYYTKDEVDTVVTNTKTDTINIIQNKIDAVDNRIDTLPSIYATTGYVLEEITKAQLEGEDVDLSGYATKDDLNNLETTINENINKVQTTLESNNSVVLELSGIVNSFSANVETVLETYVTSGTLDTYSAATKDAYEKAIEDAKDEVYTSAVTYTDGKVSAAQTAWEGEISKVVNDVTALSGIVNSFSANVETVLETYVTTGTLNTYSAATKDAYEKVVEDAKDEVYASAATYTDSKVGTVQSYLDNTNSALEILGGKVDILIAEDESKSTRDIVAEEVVKIVANADEDFDTLKEIADWIVNDTIGAAQMANDIAILKTSGDSINEGLNIIITDIDKLDSDIESLSGTIMSNYATTGYVLAEIAKAQLEGEDVDLSGYATKDDLSNFENTINENINLTKSDLQTHIDSNTSEIVIIKENIGNLNDLFDDCVTDNDFVSYKNEVNEAINDAKNEINESINTTNATIETVKNNLETDIDNTNSTIETLRDNINEIFKDYVTIETLNTFTGNIETNITESIAEVIETVSGYTNTSIELVKSSLQDQIDSIESKTTTIEEEIGELGEQITKVSGEITNIGNSLSSYATTANLEEHIAEFSENVNTVNNELEKFQTSIDSINSNITNIQTSLETINGDISTNKSEIDFWIETHETITSELRNDVDLLIDVDANNRLNTIEGDTLEIHTTIDNIESNILLISGITSGFINDVKTSYVSKEFFNNREEEILNSSYSYTNTKINELEDVYEKKGVSEINLNAYKTEVDSLISGTKAWVEGKNYLTTHQDISHLAIKTEVDKNITDAKDEIYSSAVTAAFNDATNKVNNLQGKVEQQLGNIEGLLDTLVNDDKEKSIRTIASEEIAKIVADAPENLDTLEEIANWIANDTTGSAQMANDITILKTSATSVNERLDGLDGEIDDLSGTVKTYYITSAATISAINDVDNKFDNYATTGIVNTLSGVIVTEYATSADTFNAIDAVNNRFDGYATTGAVFNLSNNVATKYATSAATVSAINQHVSMVNSQVGILEKNVIASANTLSGNIEDTINTLSSDLTTAINKRAIITSDKTSNKMILLGACLSSNNVFTGGTLLQASNTPIYMQNGELYSQSDERLKDFADDIIIDFDKLSNIPKRYFKYKNSEEWHIGTSAQAIREVYPEIVNKCDDGTLSVAYDKLSIIALAAIDKLYNENIELKERLKLIEEKLGI